MEPFDPVRARRYQGHDPVRVPLGYEEFAGDKQFATTLARGIELLRCFSPRDPVLGNRELADRTGLPRSTISRLTYTLTVLGYLRQTPKYGKYQLGSALVSTAYPLLASIGLRQLARPQMNALADETGGSVSMGVRDRLNIVLIETSRSRGRVRTPVGGSRADTGLTVPIGGSAIGRAYLAGCDLESRDALQNAIRVKTPDDWRRWSPGIAAALRDYPRLGCCVAAGDLVPDVRAVAAPFGRTGDGELIVFNCSFQGPAPPRAAAWLRNEVGPRLVAMVRELRATSQVA